MRIRSTKPEFWRSERIASVDWAARLVLKGLESYVDDNGVGKDDLALIVADVFPRDLSRNPTGTLQKVSEAMTSLAEAGLLWRYEASGTKLIFISFWEQIQRIEKPSTGRLPRPDGTMKYRESEIGAFSGSIPGGLPEPSGLEQGNRGTGEQSSSSEPDGSDPDSDEPYREDVEKVCQHLRDRIVGNGSKPPTITKAWRRSARLLIDRDQRTVPQILAAIDWCQDDEFWRSNILSMPKLREKYDQLRLAAQKTKPSAKAERLTFGGGDRPSWEM